MKEENLNVRYNVPFTMIDSAILLSENLTVYQKTIYCILCAYASNTDKSCYPSYSTIAKKAGCSRKKAINTVSELISLGLLEKQEQTNAKGENISNIYYIRTKAVDNSVADGVQHTPGSESHIPPGKRDIPRSVSGTPKLYSNNYNHINYNHENYQSIGKTDRDGIERLIKENIEYDILTQDTKNINQLDEIVMLMLDTVSSTAPAIRVGGNDFPREVVKSRLLKLNDQHIQYVMDSLNKNTTKVQNIRAYLLTALYNAPSSMDSYYQAEVNHDLGF